MNYNMAARMLEMYIIVVIRWCHELAMTLVDLFVYFDRNHQCVWVKNRVGYCLGRTG